MFFFSLLQTGEYVDTTPSMPVRTPAPCFFLSTFGTDKFKSGMTSPVLGREGAAGRPRPPAGSSAAGAGLRAGAGAVGAALLSESSSELSPTLRKKKKKATKKTNKKIKHKTNKNPTPRLWEAYISRQEAESQGGSAPPRPSSVENDSLQNVGMH